MYSHFGLPTLVVGLTCIASLVDSRDEIDLTCDTARGWTYLGRGKCYKLYHQNDVRAWDRARDVCNSYGSKLVQIDDQYENYDIGMYVENKTGAPANFWTGLSNAPDPNGCSTCTKFKWDMGPVVTHNQAFWADNMPDDADGNCIYASRNTVNYISDRPFAWAYDKCVRKRPFVCEKMAIPEGCFPCFTSGFARLEDVCNGQSDCTDGSDEINCEQRSHYYHTGPSGTLATVPYLNSKTYSWAIETPLGSIACIQFENLQTENLADFFTIYGGSIIETAATRLARISGNQGSKAFCSSNNMMFVTFSSDSAVTGTLSRVTWRSETIGSSETTLIAMPSSQVYTVDRFQVDGVQSFLSNRDYIFIINAETPKDNIVTVEIEAMDLHDSDKIMFYDGDEPSSDVLATMCNNGCDNTKLVFSTGSSMSVILRTGSELSRNVNFSFKYRQGCYFETTADYGEVFSPGFPAGLNYPHNLHCEWIINSQHSLSFLFSPETVMRDTTYGRVNNGDFLKIFDNGSALHTNTDGFGTNDLQSRTIHATTGKVKLEFTTSPTRNARGFMATFSKGCENPMYDVNTIVSTGTAEYSYTARMTLRCATGYDFLQAQIAPGTTQVQLECGYKGEWLNYKEIPRCYPKYCGDIPNINNGYIANSTGSVYGSVAYYECYPGSTLSGSSTITCEDNGRWSLEPSCNAATCPYTSSSRFISNGDGVLTNGNGFEIGSIITYTCDEGYELVGEPIRHCQNDGQFSSAPPSCTPLTCYLPDVKMQIPWSSQLIPYGSSVSLACMNGYTVSNQTLNPINCKSDRTITEMPECIDVDECDSTLTPCSHFCTNIDGSYICSCPPGYELSTNNQDCNNIDECATPSLNNCDGRCNDNLGSYSCVCDPPYQLYTSDGTSGYMLPAGETGLLPTDTFYINHTCVLLECPTPNALIANAVLMTKREHHRVGDSIEYQCNLGYSVRRSMLTCEDNGDWSGTVPDCINIQCPSDVAPSSPNPAVYNPGPYSYGEKLYLNCTVAGDEFSNFRFCTYNPATDTYELQGAPYFCGVVDCGTPMAVPGSQYVGLSSTTFGSSFTFTCEDTLTGTSQAQDVTVRCLKDGNWDFGSLNCVGRSCLDPGFPAGGDIVATSLADQSEVNFKCYREGYSLSHTDPLRCSGNTFAGSPNVPTCFDNEKPVFTNCDTEISLQKYSLLADRLPGFSLRDNTGIKSLTIDPVNANSTLYVTTPITVLYRATDYADNTATCTVSVKILDEIPPVVNCPPLKTIELSGDDDRENYEVLIDSITKSDNEGILSSSVSTLPVEFTINELYNTYTYTGQVTDTSNNIATCRAQIFVTAAACSDASFKTPLDSVKSCEGIPGGRRCTVTCNAGYTLVNGNTQSFECLFSNGQWSGTVTACVRDVTKPEIECPASRTLFYVDSSQYIDFTGLPVDVSDNNDLNTPVFQPEAKNFTANDLYQTTTVQVTVTDAANNVGRCYFQYTLLPSVCSPSALPVTLNAKPNVCTQTNTGYQCIVECNDSFVLRGYQKKRTISCTTGSAWPEVFPACISDVIGPNIICPRSRAEYIADGDDNRVIDFSLPNSDYNDVVATDNSGVTPTVEFFPSQLTVSASYLNIAPRTVQVVATDGNGNRGTCSFQVVVLADVCSPLSLPPLDNGQKVCTQGTGSWSCNMTCNNGYGFHDSTDAFIITSCTNGQAFNKYIPGCVSRSQTVDKVFVGKLRYEYQPSDGTFNIPNSCLLHYVNQQKLREASMEARLDQSCSATFEFDITVQFFDDSYVSEIIQDASGNNRRVVINSDYTITNNDPQKSSDNIYTSCSDLYGSTVNNANSAYPFKDPIDGDGNLCPGLEFVQASQTSTDTTCPTPYYQSIIDNTVCTRCPMGTESTSTQCTVCSVGEYGVGSTCASCGTGTTRYPGASSSSDCVLPCAAGSVSPSGFQPCYQCPVGSYAGDTQTCVPCPTGETTQTVGSSSQAACVQIQSVTVAEPCAQGTTSDGNGGCDLCPLGTFGTSTASTCQACFPSGTTTYIEGATSRTACYAECSNGLISSTGRSPCSPCQKGSRFLNSTYCTPCPNGQTTVETGAISCVSEISLRVLCPRGTSRNAVSGICEKCPIGTYNSQEEGSCASCGSSRSTYVDGATSSSMCFEKCTSGFFSATGLSPCQPCGIGNYWVSATECTACPNGGTTATTSATSISGCIDPCPAGQFSYNGFNMNGISCRNCPPSHYQTSTQSTTCNRCSTTQFSILPGSTVATACLNAVSLCITNRCQNGGTCRVDYNTYVCDCAIGYYGSDCQFAVNYCNSNPCFNGGTCSYDANGHSCQCPANANGPNCENIVKTCDTSTTSPTCLNNGHCINYVDGPKCLCREGFAGARCATNTSICTTNPCSQPGTLNCEDVSFGNNLRRKCICRTGYEGIDCQTNTDDCASNPCINGGTCTDGVNSFGCTCKGGYSGTYCEIRGDRCTAQSCNSPNSVCVDDYNKEVARCICGPGYAFGTHDEYSLNLNMAPEGIENLSFQTGTVVQCREDCDTAGNSCQGFVYLNANSACYILNLKRNMIPTNGASTYEKERTFPDDDFYTPWYNIDSPGSASQIGNSYHDEERLSTLTTTYGLNICGGTTPLDAKCCIVGQECDENDMLPGMQCDAQGSVCTQGSFLNPCPDYRVKFKCAAHRVFSNNQCQIKTDYCSENPCQNGGQCQVLNGQGHSCFCQPGYTGLNCQTDIDDCANNPCQNGATCVDKVNGYECQCATGFEGFTCNNPINYCNRDAVTCSFSGNCRNRVDGHYCECNQGYEGSNCETEINFCRSNPCTHDSTCVPQFNDYTCNCAPGYFGRHCDQVVDNCLSTGSQCQATCRNLFNGYYCECPANTYGTNCENQPDPCGNYNKCLNSGVCSGDGESMNCTCPTQYEGDGCQIRADLCGGGNRCQNNAECSLTSSGYTCSCPDGYTGTNCEVDINECSPNPCTGGAQCYNDINRYTCICPIGRTGTDCSRANDPNYDLYFHHPMGLGYAWLPYYTQVTNLNALSVSLWVRFAEAGSEGVYLTKFIGPQLSTATRFMDLTEKGVRIYKQDGPSDHFYLQFTRQATINDGNWHLVQVLYDMANGNVKLYADTILSTDRTAPNLVINDNTYKMWVVLGCYFDPFSHACTGNSFKGYLSQINWYDRLLTFQRTGNQQGEIPLVYTEPQRVLNNAILVMNGYEIESGVDRLIPSAAHGERCDVAGRSPPCRFYIASEVPSVTGCPADMTVDSTNPLVVVTWTEPVFRNLGNGDVQKNYLPGATFSWGEHEVKYIATSPLGYKAYCIFTVFVRNNPCERPPNPFSGTQNCVDNNPEGWKGCRISCTNSNSATFRIDRDHQSIYTCGPSGHWNVAKPFKKFRYPSCGEVQEEARIDVHIRVVYDITTAACNAAKTNLEIRIREEMSKLHNLYTNTLCRQTNCSDVEITITCDLQPGSQFTYITLVNIRIPQADARTTLDGEVTQVDEFLSYFVLAQKVLNFETIADGNIVDESFVIIPTKICPTGQVLRGDDCVECGPGNFFKYTDSSNLTAAAICDDCPLGTYQNMFAQSGCTPCPGGTTTEMTGTYDFSDCKKKCTAGQFYDSTINDCSPCAIGYFQPLEGQFRCEFCGAGYTTEFTGSVSRDKCKATCTSGYQISTDTCVACPIGQYRDVAESRTCVNCPTGIITQNEASTSRADCNIPACYEGYFYNAATNSCAICPVGEFQDQIYQTSCKSCGNPANYSTSTAGSQSESDCFYYCPSGYEVIQEGSCRICSIGTYKDNNESLQNMCGACPADYRTPGQGSTNKDECSIYKCAVGYKANADNTGCDACPLGYYQDVEYSTDCKQCEDGYSTRNTNSTSPNDCEQYCPSGYEKLSTGACNPCPRGTYKDNREGLFMMCTPCSSIFTTIGGASTSILECKIRTCPAGTRRNADDSGCVGCELGTFQPASFQQTCIGCEQGKSTRQVNSTSADQCEAYCSSGQELTSDGCKTCPRGYYKDNNIGLFEECTLCPTDVITQGAGATTRNDCNVANCTAGQYRDETNNLCLPCPIGTFQPNWWQNSCVVCGTDKTTEQIGSTQESQCILVCQPGFEDAGGFCKQCARGYWKTEEAATTCKPCNPGSTTEGQGSTSIDNCTLPACLEGYYLDRPNSQCLRCPYDTFQNEIWMETCKTCEDGTVTLQQGSKDRTDCVANCSSGREYNPTSGSCDICEIGYYRDQASRSQTDCQMCPVDFITATRESKSAGACTVANCSAPGTYRDTGSNTCKPCPLDTYNNQKWRTACTRCPTGFGTKLEGTQTSSDCIKICDPGTYLGTNGACLVCPRGTYKSDQRAEACTQCPNGLLTANTGQISSATCVISPCIAGQSYSVATQQCSNCPVGTYQPNAGQFECVDCPFLIKFTPRTGATSENECRSPCDTGEEFNTATQTCAPCRQGYYQPQRNQFTCIQCPAGRRFTASVGATTETQCFSPCDTSAGNDCSDNATCSITSGSTGYTCSCFSNFDDTGSVAGRTCIHKCDRGYCRNGGTCVRDPRPSCTCSEWYEGNQCQSRIHKQKSVLLKIKYRKVEILTNNSVRDAVVGHDLHFLKSAKGAEDLSDDTMDIVIPVAIGVGGLILLLTALAVCLLCRARKKTPKGPPQYSDYYGDRVDKASLHSYDYGSRPFYNGNGSRLMLAPYSEMQYANSALKGDSDQYSNLDAAVYQA